MSGGRSRRARPSRARRGLPAVLLDALDANERAAALWLMPDELAAQLKGLPVEDARAEVRGFIEGMERRGYDMANLADLFDEGDR